VGIVGAAAGEGGLAHDSDNQARREAARGWGSAAPAPLRLVGKSADWVVSALVILTTTATWRLSRRPASGSGCRIYPETDYSS
jgi:hypothetical protein